MKTESDVSPTGSTGYRCLNFRLRIIGVGGGNLQGGVPPPPTNWKPGRGGTLRIGPHLRKINTAVTSFDLRALCCTYGAFFYT